MAEEQVSLARVALGEADYLARGTNAAATQPLEVDEACLFLNFWKSAPLGCIRSMNQGIGRLKDPFEIHRFIEAAVDLEILMDRTIGPAARTGETNTLYLQDGYTVMAGSIAGRQGSERIGVDKEQLRSRLVESKEQALTVAATERLLAAYYDAVVQDLERAPRSVEYPAFTDDERVSISLYFKEGVRLSRRLALHYQLCLQEAGVASLRVEGTLRLFGTKVRHAWNLAWFDGKVALVDVTLPGIECPLILVGSSPEEVYREASRYDRLYRPAADCLYAVVPGSGREPGSVH